ncbi:MAG: hypothetical protein F6K09_31840 [Merismopedia sp. SIO2A8]|nr:hypothetical protein [Merismopedia sp. SIO2A8]
MKLYTTVLWGNNVKTRILTMCEVLAGTQDLKPERYSHLTHFDETGGEAVVLLNPSDG